MLRSKLGAWALYLVIAVCLAPVLVPPGPGRTAIVDIVNAIALAIFTVLFRQASMTLNDFIVGLAEGEERVVEAPPAPPQLPPSEPGA